jgi:hypothetical protein
VARYGLRTDIDTTVGPSRINIFGFIASHFERRSSAGFLREHPYDLLLRIGLIAMRLIHSYGQFVHLVRIDQPELVRMLVERHDAMLCLIDLFITSLV